MRKLVVGGMLALALGCAGREPVGPISEPAPPPPLVHRVEWQGQTLEQIAGWYTGKKANWEKLAKPVNPDLERCCVSLRVGREVLIPSPLLVTVEPMPKAKGKAKATAAKPAPETEAKAAGAKAEKHAAKDEPAEDEPVTSVPEAPAPGEKEGIGIAPVKPGSGPASGKVDFKGDAWSVADGLAYSGDDGEIAVALSSKEFDRRAIAKDGKIDSFDVLRHNGMNSASSLTLKVKKDGTVGCVDFATQSGGGSSCNSDISEGFKLARQTDDAIAGSLAFTSGEDKADLRFDLPIVKKVERGGDALPAGGGEAGAAVLANFAAIHAGDYEKAKALNHPEKRKMMEANDAESREMFELYKAITPTDVKILGGRVEGDTAVLDFEGKADGQPVKGTIDVERFEGKWYLDSVNTTQ